MTTPPPGNVTPSLRTSLRTFSSFFPAAPSQAPSLPSPFSVFSPWLLSSVTLHHGTYGNHGYATNSKWAYSQPRPHSRAWPIYLAGLHLDIDPGRPRVSVLILSYSPQPAPPPGSHLGKDPPCPPPTLLGIISGSLLLCSLHFDRPLSGLQVFPDIHAHFFLSGRTSELYSDAK